MIFYPSESFILGLFIIAAMFYFVRYSYIAKLCELMNSVISQANKEHLNRANVASLWSARFFLLVAIALGLSSSLMPIN
ncbi:putative A1 precursor [Salmonella phage S124]|uniref:Putative A1 n=1 Tax=Salmonella phage S124 TaxID=2231351 RepID=A0A2Z5HTI9_9CAUD|nr:membrane protein [Salmonella phage S124]AXC43197.1 putative A1 precursor [Salmonella phage S124]